MTRADLIARARAAAESWDDHSSDLLLELANALEAAPSTVEAHDWLMRTADAHTFKCGKCGMWVYTVWQRSTADAEGCKPDGDA